MSFPASSRLLCRTAFALYGISLALPATFNDTGVTGWGWRAAFLSLLALPATAVTLDVVAVLSILPLPLSNLGFFAAAYLLSMRRPLRALVASIVSVASMVYVAFLVPEQPSELLNEPAGRLGPGYYLWLMAGVVMLVAAARTSRAATGER